jgi:enoyl-CoA hydratase/carnithine racemase
MSPAHDSSSLKVSVSEGIAVLTIDRQEWRNALDDVTMRALADTFTAIAGDDAVRAVLATRPSRPVSTSRHSPPGSRPALMMTGMR